MCADETADAVRRKKAEIRRRLRRQRRELPEEQRRAAQQKLCGAVLTSERWQNAGIVLAYVSLEREHEADLSEVIEASWAAGKMVAVPRVRGKDLDFCVITGWDDLEDGAFGVREPKAGCPVLYRAEKRVCMPETSEEAACVPDSPGQSVCVLVPGVAFDATGRRLGYGGGYYDRFFASHPELADCAAGVGFAWQMCDELPAEETDVPLPALVTENGWKRTKNSI